MSVREEPLEERDRGAPRRPTRALLWRTVDDGLAVLAVLVILGLLLPNRWFALVVLIVAMATPTLLAARFQRRRVRRPKP